MRKLTVLFAVALAAPLATAAPTQLQPLDEAYANVISGAREVDTILLNLICDTRPEEPNCRTNMMPVLEQYKHHVISVSEIKKNHPAERARLAK